MYLQSAKKLVFDNHKKFKGFYEFFLKLFFSKTWNIYLYTSYLILKILYAISAIHGDGHVGSAGRGGTAGLDGRGGYPCIFQQPFCTWNIT